MSLEQLLFGVEAFLLAGVGNYVGCFVFVFFLVLEESNHSLGRRSSLFGIFSCKRSTADPFFKWRYFCLSVSNFTSSSGFRAGV